MDFVKTSMIPLVRNKSGDTSNVNNCRPIVRVTVGSKIFEIKLLEFLTPCLDTTDNSNGHCILAFKMLFSAIKVPLFPKYSCFLDA